MNRNWNKPSGSGWCNDEEGPPDEDEQRERHLAELDAADEKRKDDESRKRYDRYHD